MKRKSNEKNEERSGRLASAMGLIDDSLVNEAEAACAAGAEARTRAPKKARLAAIIAAAAMLLTAGGIFGGIMIKNAKSLPEIPEGIKLTGSAYYTDGVTELPDELKSINVTADGSPSRIISPSATLCVTTAGKTDSETLVQYLSVSPQIPVTVSQKSDTEFLITPAQGSFAPGTVYNLKLGDPDNPASSYAFQTESELMVKTLLPADKGLGVPADSGIEITFSEALSSANELAKYFSVKPAVKGSWKLYPDGRTVAFIPQNELDLNTVYEYEVKPGVKAASGRTLKEGVNVKFRTSAGNTGTEQGYVHLSAGQGNRNLSACFSSADTPYIRLNVAGYKLKKDIELSASVYKYPSVDKAYDAVKNYEKAKSDGAAEYPVSGLTHITDFSSTVSISSANQLRPYSNSTETITLPSGLENGVYLIKIKASSTGSESGKKIGAVMDCFVQITDLRAYTVSSDGKTLVYIMNPSSGPVANAKITGEKYTPVDGWDCSSADFSGITVKNESNGIYVTESRESTCLLMTAEADGESLLICSGTAQTDTGNYTMKYLYTDRETYFGSDRVNFWGFIVPAYADSVLPETVYLQCGNSSIRTPLAVDKNGFFEGSYAIEDMCAGGISLKITDAEGRVITSKFVCVTDEEKPQITASISFDKLFYRYGETVTATLKATFFDGTPVNGIRFSFSASSGFAPSKDSGETDKNGEITIKIRTGMPDYASSTDPVPISLYAQLDGFETQSLYIGKSVLYFHSDYVFRTVWNTDSRKLTLNEVDTSKLLSESDLCYPLFPDNTVGKPASGKVSYTLVKYVITKTKQQGYDTYSKRSYSYYTYKTNETTEKSGTFEFVNGEIDLPMYKVSGFTGGYYYKISYNDGRKTYTTTVSAVANSKSTGAADGGDYYRLVFNRDGYSAGDAISISLDHSGDTVDTVFWILSANGIDSYSVGKSYEGKFSETMIPGARIFAVYYDEAHDALMFASDLVVYDATKNASLSVELIPDGKTYKPGDTAKVKIRVTGPDGKPVKSGKVLLSVVDEACFALGEQNVRITDAFFNSLGKEKNVSTFPYGDYYVYYYTSGSISQKPVRMNERRTVTSVLTLNEKNGSGYYYSADDGIDEETLSYVKESPAEPEKTGGNTDDGYRIREFFSDNPAFAAVEIGTDGTAEYVFTVPDNITSWRITACAATGLGRISDIMTGNTVTDVICTQSFFINSGVCTRYIEGDDVSLSARSYGTGADGKVSYTAVLYDAEANELLKLERSENAQKHAWINFGKLGTGSYSAVIYAKCGSFTDAVRVTFEVVKTASVTDVSRDITPDELRTLAPLSYPLTLTFHSAFGGYGKLDNITSRLLYRNDAGRSDMLAAKYVALGVYERLYGKKLNESPDEIRSLFGTYTYGGFVPLLQYSSPDNELTAKILAVCPDILDSTAKNAIISVLSGQIGKLDAESDVVLCSDLLALASLGEPVLDRLYSVAGQAKNYSLEAKLYLCAAFAAIGDYSAASDIWAEIRTSFAVEDSEYGTLYVKAGSLQEQVKYSSLALIACSRFNKTDASALAEYLLENGTNDETGELALAAYLRFFAPVNGEDKVMTLEYTLAGKTEKVEISRGKSFTLNLTKSEAEAFSIDGIDEGIVIHATYGGTAEEAYRGKIDSSRVKIEKTIEPAGNGLFNVTLRISGTSARVYDSFRISDWIPSGARFFISGSGYSFNRSGSVQTSASVYNTSGQQMNGYVSIYNEQYKANYMNGEFINTCPEYDFSVTVSYKIRGAVAGEFVIEPAIISNPSTNVYSMSKRMKVIIADPTSGQWKIS